MGYLEDADDGLDPIAREDGLVSGLLRKAHTMIGHKRLNSLQNHMEAVLRDNIPGDFVECGVWRGGASIFMRAILKEYGVTDRSVWVVDSFQGLHIPDYDKFPDEQRNPRVPLWEQEWLRISMDEVKRNFQRYELLDDQVKFVSGWVEDTLPTCPIDKLAVLRIDVDMYEPTKVVLDNLYPKLSVGGFCDLDDYPIMKPVVRAVDDYRSQFVVNDKITVLDGYTGAYWRKER
jgi:hypothetical protein